MEDKLKEILELIYYNYDSPRDWRMVMRRISKLIFQLIVGNVWPLAKRVFTVYRSSIIRGVSMVILLAFIVAGSKIAIAFAIAMVSFVLQFHAIHILSGRTKLGYFKEHNRKLTIRVQELEADVIGLQSQPLSGKRIPMA